MDGRLTPSAAGVTLSGAESAVRYWLVVALGVVFTLLLNLWVFWAELSSGGANIAGGNPPVPVLLALVFLLLLRRRLPLTDAELVTFYIFAVFAFLPTTLGGVRAFFPCLTTPFYYAAPENRLKEFWQLLPDWWVPRDALVIQEFFEGAGGRVPWAAWFPFLLRWGLFFAALWAVGWGLAWTLAPRWLSAERLNFPLARLPLHMAEGFEGRPFFASRLTWWGVAIGAVPTTVMAACSFFRPVERFWDLGAHLTDRPFSALRPLLIYPLVEGIGFGYFVSQDALFSVWFGYATLKALNFIGVGLLGWDVPDFPFPSAQSFGGYLAMAALLLLRTGKVVLLQNQWASLVLAGGLLVIVVWMLASGMGLMLAGLYASVLLGVTTTYTRVRAELGMPYTNVHPYGAQREFWSLFGMSTMLRLGGKRGLVTLVGLFWLIRLFFLFQVGAYGVDAVKLAQAMTLSVGRVWLTSLTGCLIGLCCAFASHLCAYYRWGANYLEGAPGTGDYRTYEAAQDYRVLGWLLDSMQPANKWHIGFAIYGAIAVWLIALMRKVMPNFPLHPLGFILGSAFGQHCPYWFPTLCIWAVKGIILRYGGLRGHRKFVPFFLGLALGHFVMTGAVWAGIVYPIVKGRWGYPLRILFQ
ncbi:hypothetical protein HRbin17_01031 [bacterium HR17]|uniref:Uncharacterized protein n=1 Tax=Candidatus Fervidibacter japonicus TaxID=2035412 RepID=A0A2H5XBF0_9BACT|nr:hypothetical protein HRbin17_01031 [bacterium HR17]